VDRSVLSKPALGIAANVGTYYISDMKYLIFFLLIILIGCEINQDKPDEKYYWTLIKDSIEFDRKYSSFKSDSAEQTKIIFGSFTKTDAEECLMFKEFYSGNDTKYCPIILFSKTEKKWKNINFINASKFDTVDCDNDNILELAIHTESGGMGISEDLFEIISLKKNKIDYLFKGKPSYDYYYGPRGRQDCKKGDTLICLRDYYFQNDKSKKEKDLIEVIKCSIFDSYEIKRDTAFMTHSQKQNKYQLIDGKYK